MFPFFYWFYRVSWLWRLIALAVLFIIFLTTIIRVHKAVHAIQERNSHVHTRRSPR